MTSICSDPAPELPGADRVADPALAALHDRLRRPLLRRPIEVLLDRWRHVDLVVEAALPRDFEEEPNLPDRIRGAWGRALARQAASPHGADPGPLPAWPVFFGPAPALGPLPSCRPFVVQTAAVGRRLFIRVRIIGLATLWAAEAERSLRQALAGGLALREHGRQRIPLDVYAFEVVWGSSVPRAPLPSSGCATLRFRTPLVIRRARAQAGTLATLPLNLWNRLRGVARWLEAEPTELASCIRAATSSLAITGDDLRPVQLQRYSATTGRFPALHCGLLGQIRLEGRLDAVWPLLCFGAFFHAGGSCALGYGRYELIPG